MTSAPKVSIVIPSFNQGGFIEETLLSLLDQNYPNLELIVMDGGSTDETTDVLKKYQEHFFYMESQKDKGQTHAINKGLEKATGDIFAWVNSDDVLFKNCLSLVAECYLKKNYDLIHSNYAYINGESLVSRTIRIPRQKAFFMRRGHMATSQPSVFYSTSLLKSMGGLNEKYRLSMDVDLWSRLFKKEDLKVGYINEYLGGFRVHDQSATSISNSSKKSMHDENPETKMILDFHFPQTNPVSRHRARFYWKIYQMVNGNYLRSWVDTKRLVNTSWRDL